MSETACQQYVISFLEKDYSSAIVERDASALVWILSRTARLAEDKLNEYRREIASDGYALNELVLFPPDGRMPWQ